MEERQPTNRARVGDALDVLHRVLCPYVEQGLRAAYGERWQAEARSALRGKPPARWDASDYLSLIYHRFFDAFSELGHEGRSRVSLLREVRKRWAHQVELSLEETRRALETTVLLLRAMDAAEAAEHLEAQVVLLMQAELQHKQGDEAAAAEDLPGEDEEEAGPGLLRRRLRQLRTRLKAPPEEPLELQRAILDAVERAAVPYRRHFDFNRLIVHVLADDASMRLRFEAALEAQKEPFSTAVHRRLAEARVPVPASLYIGWRFHRRPPERLRRRMAEVPYCVELVRRSPSTTATVTVVRGRAEEASYVFKSGSVVTVGRMAEVIDGHGRLVRRNHIAFLDEEARSADERAVQETVSRVHARIAYDEAAAAFCVYDDQSTWGTSVVREGYPVPLQVRQQPVPLQDGDLLYFGKACVRFTLGRVGR